MRRIILIISIFFAVAASAQNNKVHVTVTEKATREPVIMGTVALDPSSQTAVTDMKGQVTFSNVPAGRYTLVARYVGFEPCKVNVNVP